MFTAARVTDSLPYSQCACRSVSGLSRPSKIQTIAYPHVLAGTSCVIAEQTGSGKTLAYILPLLQVTMSLFQKAVTRLASIAALWGTLPACVEPCCSVMDMGAHFALPVMSSAAAYVGGGGGAGPGGVPLPQGNHPRTHRRYAYDLLDALPSLLLR
jgi:hypothetical protein